MPARPSRTPGQWHWRDWPGGLSDAGSDAVGEHLRRSTQRRVPARFYQFIADRSLGAAQHAAKAAGMPIGLISDLAVGVDSGGSQCWARPDQTLLGLSVGAPPDLLNTSGQSWGLAAFSPRGPAAERLRRLTSRCCGPPCAMPAGCGSTTRWGWRGSGCSRTAPSPADGAYLHFPVDDMLRLIRLESHRHRAIVLGEDLGTLPEGFQGRISSAGVLGMRVLWFERADGPGLHLARPVLGPRRGLHDQHARPGDGGGLVGRARHRVAATSSGRSTRAAWRASTMSAAATGACCGPPCRPAARRTAPPPPPSEPEGAVDAAIRHVGGAACALTLIPLEDALALPEQPNFPGTLDEHPNWRRRMPAPAATLLDSPAVAARLQGLDAARRRS